MLAILLAVAAGCAMTPNDLIAANRAAMGERPARGTAIARYAYEGQGLTGATSSTIDLATGMFTDTADTPPTTDVHGFDGRTAWLRDLSGAYVPQGRNGRRGIAVSEAFLNTQAWSLARLEMRGCDVLQVTPPDGVPFEAHFDRETHLLSSVRQTLAYGVSIETKYADYQRRAGLMVPTRLDVVTEDDPSTLESMRLTSFKVTGARPWASYSMPVGVPGNGSLPSGQVRVPFRLLNNHVIVDVIVNGKGPFPFLLDTGGHDIITPATLAALDLASQGKTPSGGGGEGLATNGYAKVDRLDVGGAALVDQTVATLDFSPVTIEGIRLGGMLGLEFMERFVVRIDYGARTATIMDRRMFDANERKASGIAVPFTFYEHMPQVAGTFDGRPARFDIDTGSRSDVTLTSPFVQRAGLRSAYPDGVLATEGWGVGGPTRSYLVRAERMTLGSVTVPRPITGLSTARRGALGDAFYDGNVGSGALKHFVVTFDYQGRKMYLKPATRLDEDTGQFDRAGMWLNMSTDGLEVMDVAKGGPADAAGIRIGDIVKEIGGIPVAGRSLSDIRSALKTAPVGIAVAIGYQRGDKHGSAILTPRKLVRD